MHAAHVPDQLHAGLLDVRQQDGAADERRRHHVATLRPGERAHALVSLSVGACAFLRVYVRVCQFLQDKVCMRMQHECD